ncbi:MAG: hypothetical protein ACRDQA_19230 [Nocardioidaceae bacterium]
MTTTAPDQAMHPTASGVRDRVWDLLVVGGGTAGLVGAKSAAGLGGAGAAGGGPLVR